MTSSSAKLNSYHASRSSESPLFSAKVVLLGQTCVGKSSLVIRFVQERFIPNTEGTIGAAFLTKSVTVKDPTDVLNEDYDVKFEIWDTAGQERYHSLAPMYYRGAQAAIILYDITSRDSFEKGKSWVAELREKSTPEQIIAFVGNKLDLSQSRVIDKEEAEKYCLENQLLFLETSAKDGTNVSELFLNIALKLPKGTNALVKQQQQMQAPFKVEDNSKQSKSCC